MLMLAESVIAKYYRIVCETQPGDGPIFLHCARLNIPQSIPDFEYHLGRHQDGKASILNSQVSPGTVL